MNKELKGGLCRECNERVVVFRKGTNHILHFLLTCVTLGWWVPIWILTSIKFGGWRCEKCGSKKVEGVK